MISRLQAPWSTIRYPLIISTKCHQFYCFGLTSPQNVGHLLEKSSCPHSMAPILLEKIYKDFLPLPNMLSMINIFAVVLRNLSSIEGFDLVPVSPLTHHFSFGSTFACHCLADLCRCFVEPLRHKSRNITHNPFIKLRLQWLVLECCFRKNMVKC